MSQTATNRSVMIRILNGDRHRSRARFRPHKVALCQPPGWAHKDSNRNFGIGNRTWETERILAHVSAAFEHTNPSVVGVWAKGKSG